MSEAGAWPVPFEIEAIDPYPYHGLAYAEDGMNWLQPSQGRPAILRPLSTRSPTPSPAPQYGAPLMSAALWDVGRPDPPFSESLHAKGGESLGRRLIPVDDGLTQTSTGPRLLMLRHGDGNELLLREETRTGLVVEILARADLPIGAMTAGISALTNPYDGTQIDVASALYVGLSTTIDRSADGTLRLLEIPIIYGTGANTTRIIAAIITVDIQESEAGEFSLSINVEANLQDCIGSATYTRNSNMQWYSPYGDIDPIDPMAQVWLGVSTGNTSVAVGSFSESFSMTNVIIGAYLDGRDAKFFRASMVQSTASSNSPAGSYWDEDDEILNWSLDKTESATESVTLTGAEGAVTVQYEYTATSSASLLRSDVVHEGVRIFVGTYQSSTNGTMTGLPGVNFEHDEVVDARDPASIGVTAALQGCALRAPVGWEPGPYIAPRSIRVGRLDSRPENFALAEMADTRCTVTAGLVISTLDDETHQPVPKKVSSTLTPAGLAGLMSDIPASAGTYPATAIYNPMTGETARAVDLPGKSIQGWL